MPPIQQESADLLVQRVEFSRILPLRWQVLRPGQPESTAHFVGDQNDTTEHWAALTAQGAAVSVASVQAAPLPKEQMRIGGPALSVWQLRGMATSPGWQGKGVGSVLMQRLLSSFCERFPGGLIWCNARERAVPFYLRHGFRVTSARFEIPGVGPHFVMQRPLQVG